MSSATTTLTNNAYTEGSIPVILVRGQGGPTDPDTQSLIASHSAHQQPAAATPGVRPDGLRADREYPRQFYVENPEWWPEGRGVPRFRPLHDNDAATRPMGASTPEVVFVSVMMTGVFVIGRVNRAWAATVGRLTKRVWVYPVGGQF